MDKCELCSLKKKTEWHYKDDDWIICNCKTCHNQMAVYRKHTLYVPSKKVFELMKIIKSLYGNDMVIRFKQRKIKDHMHLHFYKK
jgi:hypothetical protein